MGDILSNIGKIFQIFGKATGVLEKWKFYNVLSVEKEFYKILKKLLRQLEIQKVWEGFKTCLEKILKKHADVQTVIQIRNVTKMCTKCSPLFNQSEYLQNYYRPSVTSLSVVIGWKKCYYIRGTFWSHFWSISKFANRDVFSKLFPKIFWNLSTTFINFFEF